MQAWQKSPAWENYVNVGIIGETSTGKSSWINDICDVKYAKVDWKAQQSSAPLEQLLTEADNQLRAAQDWPKQGHNGIKKDWILHCVVVKPDRVSSTMPQKRIEQTKTMKDLHSFIAQNASNTLRLVFTDKMAAAVGSGETTMDPTPYECVLPRRQIPEPLRVWDLPGSGTRNWPEETYGKLVGLKYFDVIILLCVGTLKQVNENLLNLCSTFNVPVYLLCNKVDIDIENNEFDYYMEADETLQLLKEEFLSRQRHTDGTLLFETECLFMSCRSIKAKAGQWKRMEEERARFMKALSETRKIRGRGS